MKSSVRVKLSLVAAVFGVAWFGASAPGLSADEAVPPAGSIQASPGAAPLVLDLRTAIARALAASPSLTASTDALLAAEARHDTALRQYIPSAVASAGYTHSGPVDPGTIDIATGGPMGTIHATLPAPLQDSTSFRLAVSQPVYTGGRIEAGIAAASAATASARADAAARRRTVAASAEQAWWNLVLASESEEAVAENLAAVSAHRADAERRLSQGTGTKSELLSWQMQEIQAGVRRRAAATDLEAARARLNILLGLPWDSPTEAAAPPEAEMGSGPVAPDSLLDTALSLRPELAAAAARISAQEASVALAQAGLLPSLYLTGSMTYADPNPKAFPQRSGFEFLWDVGLVASIDVGRVPASLGQIADAKAQVSQARDLLRQTRDAVTQEVIQARFELEKARDRFETSTAAVSLAQENLRVQNDRFSAGLALASEVADAEASLLSAKLERFRSRVEWELAHAALRDAAGGDAASDGK